MTARLPSLNGLRAFEAAARHLSFTVAASELNVTQTAISHQIRRLEQELGIRLFVRQNRSLALTPEARDYLPGVRAAFNDLRLATDRLLGKDNDHVLTVSTLASLAAKLLLPRLSAFQGAHPRIDVHINTSTSLVDFKIGDVHAAIRYGRVQWPGQGAVGGPCQDPAAGGPRFLSGAAGGYRRCTQTVGVSAMAKGLDSWQTGTTP